MQLPSRGVTRRGLLATGGAILAGGCVSAERTPEPGPHDWPLAGGDPGRTGFAPDASPPRSEPDVAWERTPDPASGRSPIVADGTLYYQTGDELYVLDPASGDGSEVGTYGAFEGTGSPSFAPSETYRDGMYLVPYGGEVAGYPAAPDTWPESIPDDGRQRMRWSSTADGPAVGAHPLTRTRRPDAQPIPVDGHVVFTTRRQRADQLTVLDVDDGSTRWSRSIGRSFEDLNEYGIRSERTVVDPDRQTIVTAFRFGAGFPGGLEARRLGDGGLEWNATIGDAGPAVAVSGDAVFTSVKRIDSDTVTLVALSVDDGSIRWTTSMPDVSRHGIAVDDSHCYHTGVVPPDDPDADDEDGPLRVTAVNRSNGRVSWERTVGSGSSWGFGVANQTPTVGGDVVLAPAGEAIYAFDRDTGERLWQFSRTVPTSGGSRSPRRPMAPVIPVDDQLVVAMTLALYGLEAP